MGTLAGEAGFPLPLRFVEEVKGDPASYVCPKCQKVVLNPVKTHCRRRICKECVPFPPLEGTACPIQGCDSCGEDAFVVPDFAGRKELKEVKAYCPHQGCLKQPSLANWEAHVMRCPYVNTAGRARGPRRDIEANKCGNVATRPKSAEKRDQTGPQHQQGPPPAPPSREDGVEVHLEFLLAGNASLQQENKALKHELRQVRTEASESHAKLEMQIGSLEQELRGCKERLSAAGKGHEARLVTLEASDACDGTLLWAIRPYAQMKADSLSGKVPAVYSPPFRVGRTGYKMCLKACLGGEKEGNGTHLSLYVVMMKGEYDALLSWPFDRTVTIEVLDQCGVQPRAAPALGKAALLWRRRGHVSPHIRRSIQAGDSSLSEAFARPILASNNPVGYSNYVAHAFLESAQRQFVKDDVLFVKATVDMEGLVLP